jgi:hypothetical protein
LRTGSRAGVRAEAGARGGAGAGSGSGTGSGSRILLGSIARARDGDRVVGLLRIRSGG